MCMRKQKLLFILLWLRFAGCVRTSILDPAFWPKIPALEPFNEGERVLILALILMTRHRLCQSPAGAEGGGENKGSLFDKRRS